MEKSLKFTDFTNIVMSVYSKKDSTSFQCKDYESAMLEGNQRVLINNGVETVSILIY